jgi:phage regulator Rha-like protein
MHPSINIQQKIIDIRGFKVMLDYDLAALYEVETRVFNQSIKRNIERFPEEFMFQLTEIEWASMSSQIVMTSLKKRPKSSLPYAFTEHGITMAASILKSAKAIQMNIAIIKAFIEMRKFINQYANVVSELNQLKQKISNHNIQLNQIYEAIENLLDDKAEQQTWNNRKRIGFKP